MQSLRRVIHFSFYLLLISFPIYFYLQGYCFFDDTNIISNALISGYLGLGNFTDFGHRDYIFWQEAFSVLYRLNPDFAWYGHILYGLSWFCLFSIAHFLYVDSHQKKLSGVIILFMVYTIGADLTILIHHNSVAFLLCGTSLLLFSTESRTSLIRSLVLIFLFALGFFFRPEAGMGSILLLIPPLLFTEKDFLKYLKRYSPIILGALVTFSILQYKTAAGNDYFSLIEPEIEYEILNKRNLVPLSMMKSEKDSIRYIAATRWFIADSTGMSPDFLRSIINSKNDRNIFFFQNFHSINYVFEELSSLVTSRPAIFLLLFLILFYALFIASPFSYSAIVTISWLLILIVFMSLSITSVSRNTDPMVFLTCCLAFMELKKIEIKKISIKLALTLCALCILYLDYCFKIDWKKSNTVQIEINEKIREQLNTRSEKYFICSISMDYFNTPPFSSNTTFTNKRLIPFEFAQYIHSEQGKEILKNNTEGCDSKNFVCRFEYALDKDGDVIILSNPQRLELYKSYLKGVYNFEINYQLIAKTYATDEVNLYKFKKGSR